MGCGGLPREGVMVEKFVPSLESLSSLGFEGKNLGCPGIFAGMSRTPGGVQKVGAKKVRAHFSFPRLGRSAPPKLPTGLLPFELLGLRQGKNNKLKKKNILWPKMAHLGTPVLIPKSPRKSLCGSLFCVLSQEMRHINFFLGAKVGGFGWGPKSLCRKSLCAFSVPYGLHLTILVFEQKFGGDTRCIVKTSGFTRGVCRNGWGSKCLCVSHFPGERRKHINKIPRKSQEKAGRVPGQSREHLAYAFSSSLVFFPALFK